LKDPGYGVDLTVRSDPVTLSAVYMGDVTLATALERRKVVLQGPEHLARGFASWFGLSSLVGIRHPM
jgi:hypothetical protein